MCKESSSRFLGCIVEILGKLSSELLQGYEIALQDSFEVKQGENEMPTRRRKLEVSDLRRSG